MSRSFYVTAHGSRIVPRAPFVISFRPPRFLVEHEGRAVAFGPVEGGLGFNPLGGASVEDVTSDVAEYPPGAHPRAAHRTLRVPRRRAREGLLDGTRRSVAVRAPARERVRRG